MNERERRELAADIATRVRMYSWQPLPEPLIQAMPDFDWYEMRAFPSHSSSSYVNMTVRWLARPQRLELSNAARVLYALAHVA